MTRFLSRVWNDPACGALHDDTNRLFVYHQATKHTYRSVRTGARQLDWHNQPDPFRSYDGARVIGLPPVQDFPDVGTFAAMAALAETRDAHAAQPDSQGGNPPRMDCLNLDWLSRLLWHSMAVSAWKKVENTGGRYSLRVNPSSGNLHPTETYIAVRAFSDIEDGFYHYRADRHALELRSGGAWTRELARALEIPWAAESPLIVGLTSIFWREAWKYRERAYRYCCHDLGHAMMSILIAAHALGLPGGAIAHFSDLRLARLLGLSGGDEAPMAFLIFPPPKDARKSSPAVASTAVLQPFAGIPNELSAEEIRYDLLLGIHASSVLPDPAGPLPRIPRDHSAGSDTLRPQVPGPLRDAALGSIVRRRRSALDFDALTPPMGREDLEQLLDFATRDWGADWRGNFAGEAASGESRADFVTLYVYVHRVRDCPPGVYRWDRANRKLEELHAANVQRVAAFLSLEQPLAGNSCFTVSMIADLGGASRIFGNRGYRYVYFEAGATGQRFYLGAETLGWNATGIGAFYDDDVHRYLGFLEDGQDSIDASVREAERASLVMLGSPASRAAARDRSLLSESGEEQPAEGDVIPRKKNEASEINDARQNPRELPRQVIYHFAVGRAVPDPRIED